MKQVHLTVMPVRWGDLDAYGHVKTPQGLSAAESYVTLSLGHPRTRRATQSRLAVSSRSVTQCEGGPRTTRRAHSHCATWLRWTS